MDLTYLCYIRKDILNKATCLRYSCKDIFTGITQLCYGHQDILIDLTKLRYYDKGFLISMTAACDKHKDILIGIPYFRAMQKAIYLRYAFDYYHKTKQCRRSVKRNNTFTY